LSRADIEVCVKCGDGIVGCRRSILGGRTRTGQDSSGWMGFALRVKTEVAGEALEEPRSRLRGCVAERPMVGGSLGCGLR
jgi:hypothetical protein